MVATGDAAGPSMDSEYSSFLAELGGGPPRGGGGGAGGFGGGGPAGFNGGGGGGPGGFGGGGGGGEERVLEGQGLARQGSRVAPGAVLGMSYPTTASCSSDRSVPQSLTVCCVPCSRHSARCAQ